jgi:hypothetical protein
MLGEGGALPCHDVLQSGLEHHDHVDLALADDRLVGFRDEALRFVEAKQHAAFAETPASRAN